MGLNCEYCVVQRLVKCREDVCAALSLPITDLELSMGMSADFEMAVLFP